VPEIGAPSARLFETARIWVQAGHQVEVVTCLPSHPFGRLYPGYKNRIRMGEDIDGITVHRHWTYRTENKGFLRRVAGHASFLPASGWFSTPRLNHPQVVIGSSPTFFAAMAARAAARRFSAPFVLEIRDLWPEIFTDLGILTNPWIIRYLHSWAQWLYREADRVVSVTESFTEHIERLGVPAKKLVTITNGADTDYWKPGERTKARLKLGWKNDEFVVLYVGAHGISHGLSALLKTAERLSDTAGLRFVFVGDGAEKAQLVKTAREKNLSNVTFCDAVPRDQVRVFYQAADLSAVPLRDVHLFSKFIPSKIFEILASGVPLIGALRGEAAEIVERSQGGVVVSPEDHGALARAIVELRSSPARLKEMSLAGRDFVSRHYSRRVLAERYLEALKDTIREAAP